jgi:hypothetical protein
MLGLHPWPHEQPENAITMVAQKIASLLLIVFFILFPLILDFATLFGPQINGKLYVTVRALQINFRLFRKILQNLQTLLLATEKEGTV